MKKLYILYILIISLFPNFIYSQYFEWVKTYQNGAYNRPYSVKVDKSGNVYVTGFSDNNISKNYSTVKYNKFGTQKWAVSYDGPGGSDDVASAMSVDSSGNIFVTGKSYDYGANYQGFDYATIKYDSNGVQQWAKRYNNATTYGDDEATSIAIVPWGYNFVTGFSYDSISNFDYTTIMYVSSNGGQGWVSRYNGPGNGIDKATSVKVTLGGNIYVTGYSQGVGTNYDYATIKYNTAGVQQWAARYNGPADSDDYATAMAISNSGNIYVTGYSLGIGTGNDIVTIKYNAAGIQQWVKKYNGNENSDDKAVSIAVDNSENVFVSGTSQGTNSDFITLKYNSSGVEQWAARYSSGFVGASSMTIDDSSNVYVAGNGIGYLTVKYNSSGILKWALNYNKICGFPNCFSQNATSVAVDAFSNVYVTGWETTLFGSSPSTFLTIKYPYNVDPGNGQKTLRLTTLIEGFYNEQSNTMVPDTITVNLRSFRSPFNIIESEKSVVNSDGTALFHFVYAYRDTSYYLDVRHRNSLETWSSTVLSFTPDSLIYNFSTAQSQAFGNNMILKGSRWTIYSGDVNQDGFVDVTDLSITDNAVFNFVTGYIAADVNGDNAVDISDLAIVDNNSENLVEVIRP